MGFPGNKPVKEVGCWIHANANLMEKRRTDVVKMAQQRKETASSLVVPKLSIAHRVRPGGKILTMNQP